VLRFGGRLAACPNCPTAAWRVVGLSLLVPACACEVSWLLWVSVTQLRARLQLAGKA